MNLERILGIKNFLSNTDISKKEFIQLLDLSTQIKSKNFEINVKDKVLGLIFDKSST